MPPFDMMKGSQPKALAGSSASIEIKANLHPLRQNHAISRDQTSGNNRDTENLSAIAPQTKPSVVKGGYHRSRPAPVSSSDESFRRWASPHFGDVQVPIPPQSIPPTIALHESLRHGGVASIDIDIDDGSLTYPRQSDPSYTRYSEHRRSEPRYMDMRADIPTGTSSKRREGSPLPDIQRPIRLPPGAKHASVSDPNIDGSSDGDSVQSMSSHARGSSHSISPSRDSAVRRPTDNHNFSLMRRPILGDDVLEELEQLRRENERLRQENNIPIPQAAHPASTYKVFHYIEDTCYLDEPQWVPGDGAPRLRASNPIRNIRYYLDQHPDIAFAVYKTYSSRAPTDLTKIETKDGVFRAPEPKTHTLSFISETMIEAVEEFVESVPNFDYFFPYFDARREIKAPYLFMYYSAPYLPEILTKVDRVSRYLLEQLDEYIQKSHGFEHLAANSRFAKGLVSKTLFKYLVRPGDVLVERAGPLTKAYLSEDWAKEVAETQESTSDDYDEWHEYSRPRGPKRGTHGSDVRNYEWKVPVWTWEFDGHFHRRRINLILAMKAGDATETIPIEQLNIIPLRFASPDLAESLEKRGRTFWQLRHGRYVSYRQSEGDTLNNVISDRYMIDIETYKKLHPSSAISQSSLPPSLDRREMESDSPPSGNSLLLFPPIIPGFNLLRKMWMDLYVDQIFEVVWNKQAFKDLVVDDETKELVQALVMKQIDVEKSTDVIQGKGNGLILLLHGGPGTGKTFTAEGVAEFAEKPLLRVTCGDVGTEAEVVEQRLQSSFYLGKIWDCVVLLDEADVFLEERDMKDLNRNALVSVFLRELEYHNGILILTSNRVGTFDEAFKSRIQLALHYENLGPSQRKKIWRNLLNRLKALDALAIDFDDIIDQIDDLSQFEMNGREIRNAITTARQLAQFKEKALCYAHLKHVIRVSGKFGKYLKDLRDGLTEDDIKRDSGLRLTYKIDKSLQKECPF